MCHHAPHSLYTEVNQTAATGNRLVIGEGTQTIIVL